MSYVRRFVWSALYAMLLFVVSGIPETAIALTCNSAWYTTSGGVTYTFQDKLQTFTSYNGKTYAISKGGVLRETISPGIVNGTGDFYGFGQKLALTYGSLTSLPKVSSGEIQKLFRDVYGPIIEAGGATGAYIGLINRNDEFGYVNIDGSGRPSYYNWKPDQPIQEMCRGFSGTSVKDPYVVMEKDGRWRTSCDETLPALFEFNGVLDCAVPYNGVGSIVGTPEHNISPGVTDGLPECNTADFEDFVLYRGVTYAITKSTNEWPAAKLLAESSAGQLAYIPDSDVNGFLAAKYGSKFTKAEFTSGGTVRFDTGNAAWFGMYDPFGVRVYCESDKMSQCRLVPDRFVWTSSGTSTYRNWAAGEPNNYCWQSETCKGEEWASITADGTWKDQGNHLGEKALLKAIVTWNGTLKCTAPPPVVQPPDNEPTDPQGEVPPLDVPLCADSARTMAMQCDETMPLASSAPVPGCAEGYTLSQDKTQCTSSAPCPNGACNVPPVNTCPGGTTLRGGVCVSSMNYLCPMDRVQCSAATGTGTCPDGTMFNPANQKCEKQSDGVCPTGYTWDKTTDRCTAPVPCPSGTTLNPVTDLCEAPANGTCGDGYTYDPVEDVCSKAPGCDGGVYIAERDRCEREPSWLCPTGYTYDSPSKRCVAAPSCPASTTYNIARDRCESAPGSCPAGYTYNPVVDTCVTSATCLFGGTLNGATDSCELAGSINCPPGMTFNATSGKCEATPTCQSGTYNPSRDRCEAAIGSCPPGYTYSTTLDKCTATVTCSQGTTFNPSTDKCEVAGGITCPNGTTYNSSSSRCEAPPTCPPGTSYVAARDRCETTLGSCPVGYSFDSSLGRCVSTPSCPSGGSLNGATDKCESASSISCATGSYNAGTGKCESTPSCPLGTVYEATRNRCEKAIAGCPVGYTYNFVLDRCTAAATCNSGGSFSSSTDRCELSATVTCPPGMSYNSSRGKCEVAPSCPSGTTYNAGTDRCESNVGSCPTGYTYSTALDRCTVSATCTDGSSLNSTSDKCEIAATVNCASGTSYNSSTGKCEVVPNCPAGTTYSTIRDRCEANIGPCPAGYAYNATLNTCTAAVGCSSGGGLNGTSDQCELPGTVTCPSGTSYNATRGKCEAAPSCSAPGSYNTTYDLCLTPSTSTTCPSGYTYNSTYGACISSPSCVGGTYSAGNDRCETPPTYGCTDPTYTYNATRGRCEKVPACPGGAYDATQNQCLANPSLTCTTGTLSGSNCTWTPTCPNGGSYDSTSGKCLNDACPVGYAYSTTRSRCEKAVSCSQGTFNSATNKCESSSSYAATSNTVGSLSFTRLMRRTPTNQEVANAEGVYGPPYRVTFSGQAGMQTAGYATSSAFIGGVRLNTVQDPRDSSCLGVTAVFEPEKILGASTTFADCSGGLNTAYVYPVPPPTGAYIAYYPRTGTFILQGITYTYAGASTQQQFPGQQALGYAPSTSGTKSGFTYSSCPSGGVLSGTQCITTTQTDPICSGSNFDSTSGVCYAPSQCTANLPYDAAAGKCSASGFCSSGSIQGGVCSTPPTITCSSGTYNATLGKCTASASCTGGALDTAVDVCHTSGTSTCVSGYSPSGSVCAAAASCGTGGTLNGAIDLCSATATFNCPTGYTYSGTYGQCYQASNCSAGSLNTTVDVCQTSNGLGCPVGYTLNGSTCQATPTCGAGGSYSASLDTCDAGSNVCAGLTLDTGIDKCFVVSTCAAGTLNATSDVCQSTFTLSCSGAGFTLNGSTCQAAPSCPGGGSYSASLNLCDGGANVCGASTILDGTSDKCYAGASCSSGTLNAGVDYCQANSGLSCPGGYTLTGGTCQAVPQCVAGGSYNSSIDLCDGGSNVCDGLTYDFATMKCHTFAACSSGTLNTSSDVCQSDFTRICPVGETLNGTVCQSSPGCGTGGSYSSSIDKCDGGSNLCASPLSLDSTTATCYGAASCAVGSLSADVCQIPYVITCPVGTVQNGGKCEAAPGCAGGVFNGVQDLCDGGSSVCASPLSLDTATDSCIVSPICGTGTFNASADVCQAEKTLSCPEGYLLGGGSCRAPPSCPGTGTFNGTINFCDAGPNVCSSPSVLDPAADVCQQPASCGAGTLSAPADRCEASATRDCGVGIWDEGAAICQFPPTCTAGTFDVGSDSCRGTVIRSCAAGLTLNGAVCEQVPICPVDSAFSLAASMGYAPDVDRCSSAPEHHCPGGTPYVGPPSTVCRGVPACGDGSYIQCKACTQGTFSESTKKCEWISTYPATAVPAGSISFTQPIYHSTGSSRTPLYRVFGYSQSGMTRIGYLSTTSFTDAIPLYPAKLNGTCLTSNVAATGSFAGLTTTDNGCPVRGWASRIPLPSGTSIPLYARPDTITVNGTAYSYMGLSTQQQYSAVVGSAQSLGQPPTAYVPAASGNQATDTRFTCPNGGTVSDSSCIVSSSSDPVCPSGTSGCFMADQCPAGDFPCYQLKGETEMVLPGVYRTFCSPNACQTSMESFVSDEDTDTGADDILDDGERDDEGNCLGTIYLFNGKDMRCREVDRMGQINAFAKLAATIAVAATGLGASLATAIQGLGVGATTATAVANAAIAIATNIVVDAATGQLGQGTLMACAMAGAAAFATAFAKDFLSQVGDVSTSIDPGTGIKSTITVTAQGSGNIDLSGMELVMKNGGTAIYEGPITDITSTAAGEVGVKSTMVTVLTNSITGSVTTTTATVVSTVASQNQLLLAQAQVFADQWGPVMNQGMLGNYQATKCCYPDQMSGACTPKEFQEAKMQHDGWCHVVGSYCSKSLFGLCLTRKETSCCFNSMLARVFHEQGRPQLKSFNGWGSAKKPVCRGFLPEEFQALDFGQMDLSEYVEDVTSKMDALQGDVEKYMRGTQMESETRLQTAPAAQ